MGCLNCFSGDIVVDVATKVFEIGCNFVKCCATVG